MWNSVMDEHILQLTNEIEKSFEPPDDKVNEIQGWFKQVYTKINASDFQIFNNLEPFHTTAKGRKKAKKIVEKNDDSLPEDVSPFDSIVSESGRTRKSTRNSRATKRMSKVSKTTSVNKTGLSDETFVVPTRSSRAASKAAVGKINSQLNLSLTKKLRRPSDGDTHLSIATNGLRTEASMDFQPAISSTLLNNPDCGSPQPGPGPSVVRAHIEQFEKLNGHNTPDEDSSQDEESPSQTPKTPYPPARVTRSKALKIRKSGGSAPKTVILKKQGSVVVKVKRLSIPRVKSNSDKKETPDMARAGPTRIPSASEGKNAVPGVKIGAPLNSEEAKKKIELLKKREKEEEARNKKKQDIMKAYTEEQKRKREEKSARAAAAREAAEKQKQEHALKLEKEKEERNKKMLLEREEKQKEEQAKKRNIAAQKAAEIEERRRLEEAARQARLRELSEEQKRNAALRLREQEEQAALKRKLEEEKQKAKKQGKENKKEVTEYKCTPTRDERPLKKPKTEEDYGLDDACASDSSDDESNPKKEIPGWALPTNRNPQLLNQLYFPKELLYQFMSCKKEVDLKRVFNASQVRIRTRTSSAVWTSPLSTTFTRK